MSNGYYNTGSWEIRMGPEGAGTMLGGGFITADHLDAWDHVADPPSHSGLHKLFLGAQNIVLWSPM